MMAPHPQKDATRREGFDLDRHPKGMNPTPEEVISCLGFQIAPEAGVFSTTRHAYRTIFRHVNCTEYNWLAENRSRPSTSETLFPIDCSSPNPIEITFSAGSEPLDAQWMQVCPGGCNEEDEHDDSDFDWIKQPHIPAEVIAKILYKAAHSRCDAVHSERAEFLQIYSQIAWTEGPGIPAYFSPSRMQIVPHSSAVTSGHLALIQARRHVDNIEVDFWTADRLRRRPSRFTIWNHLAVVSRAIVRFSQEAKRQIQR
jgi:hypothetical protein